MSDVKSTVRRIGLEPDDPRVVPETVHHTNGHTVESVRAPWCVQTFFTPFRGAPNRHIQATTMTRIPIRSPSHRQKWPTSLLHELPSVTLPIMHQASLVGEPMETTVVGAEVDAEVDDVVASPVTTKVCSSHLNTALCGRFGLHASQITSRS